MPKSLAGKISVRVTALLLALSAVLPAGCVKVQFEPETRQQQTDTATLQSKEMRSRWAERISRETTGQRLWSARGLVDSVTVQYLLFGNMVAERWRAANQSQTQPMTDTDARAMVSKGTEAQQPMFKAYEDMFEFALEQIKLTREVDDSTLSLLTKYGDYLYESYSDVFYPTGTVEQYEEKMYVLRQTGHDLGKALDDALRVYR